MDRVDHLKQMLLQGDTLQACYRLARELVESEQNPPRWLLMLAGWSCKPGTERAIVDEVLSEILYEEQERGNRG